MAFNNVAIITGSSRGIGAATAKLFAENGYAVAEAIFWLATEKSSFVKDRFIDPTGGI